MTRDRFEEIVLSIDELEQPRATFLLFVRWLGDNDDSDLFLDLRARAASRDVFLTF